MCATTEPYVLYCNYDNEQGLQVTTNVVVHTAAAAVCRTPGGGAGVSFFPPSPPSSSLTDQVPLPGPPCPPAFFSLHKYTWVASLSSLCRTPGGGAGVSLTPPPSSSIDLVPLPTCFLLSSQTNMGGVSLWNAPGPGCGDPSVHLCLLRIRSVSVRSTRDSSRVAPIHTTARSILFPVVCSYYVSPIEPMHAGPTRRYVAIHLKL